MAETVAAGVREAGIHAIRIHDLSRTHVSYVLRDVWRFKGLIVGTPTYDTGVFPPVQSLLHLLEEKKLQHRSVGVFGTYGWSGGGVKSVRAFVEANRLAWSSLWLRRALPRPTPTSSNSASSGATSPPPCAEPRGLVPHGETSRPRNRRTHHATRTEPERSKTDYRANDVRVPDERAERSGADARRGTPRL